MNSLVWILAGSLILVSVWLSQVVSHWWLLLALVTGGYLVVSGSTGHCPGKSLLRKQLGRNEDDTDKD
jgi:hypothetical protein